MYSYLIVSIHKNLDSFNTYVEFLLQTLDLVTNKKLTFLVVVDGFKLHNMAAAERFFFTVLGESCGPHNSPYVVGFFCQPPYYAV